MSLSSGLQTALTGMQASQTQVNLVSQNISNLDAEGYTAKSVSTQTVVLGGEVVGVKVGDVTREVSESLLKSYLTSNSLQSSLTVQSEYLESAQLLVGTAESSSSISTYVSDLQSSFATLALDVTSAVNLADLVIQATDLTDKLNYLSDEIQTLRTKANSQISTTIDEVNALLDSLDTLNDSVVKATALGYDSAVDLMDQRDQALRDLSELIDISYYSRSNGEVVIQTNGGVNLLDHEPNYLSYDASSTLSATSSYENGYISGIMVDGQDITNTLKSGELAGLVEIRDETMPDLQEQLDELSKVLIDKVNTAHNQGTSFPAGDYELSGTRTFTDSENQTIKITSGDVRISIFNTDGSQLDTTTLLDGTTFTNGGTIDEMAEAIQTWMVGEAGLSQAKCYVDDAGNLQVETGNSEYFISFTDVKDATLGSDQQSVGIEFGVDGQTDGTTRDFEGFSSFFGLNDFFVTDTNTESVYDSNVLSKSTSLGVSAKEPVTLSFQNSNGSIGSVTITAYDSVSNVVEKINALENSDIKASLVSTDTGYVLRIETNSGDQLDITDGGSGLLDRLGIEPSNVGLSSSIGVNSEIIQSPNNIVTGKPQFNAATGTYELNAADNSVINAMAGIFSSNQSFNQAGTLGSTESTLRDYAAGFVGTISSLTSNVGTELAYQSELTTSIYNQESAVSGVNLDEQLAQLIIYQQSYSACAQAFTANKELLDALFTMMN